MKFLGRSGSCSGHAGKFFVHPEIILKSYGRERARFLLNHDPFFRFHRLMEPLGPSAPGHQSPRKLVHDYHLASPHHVILVAPKQRLSAEGLLQVMHVFNALFGIDIRNSQDAFYFFNSLFCDGSRAEFFIHAVIRAFFELGGDFRENAIKLARFLVRRGDNQRSARFVNQNGVHLVHNREVMPPLRHLLRSISHIIPKVIKAVFVIGAVGHVGRVGLASRGGAQKFMDNLKRTQRVARRVLCFHRFMSGVVKKARFMVQNPDRKPQGMVNLPHPNPIAPGKIIVDRNHMHALPRKRVKISRQSRDESLSFSGFHLRYFPLMQRYPAEHLNVKMALAQRPLRRFADRGKSFRQQIIKAGALVQTFFELRRFIREFLSGKFFKLRFQGGNFPDQGSKLPYFPFVGITENARQNAHNP